MTHNDPRPNLNQPTHDLSCIYTNRTGNPLPITHEICNKRKLMRPALGKMPNILDFPLKTIYYYYVDFFLEHFSPYLVRITIGKFLRDRSGEGEGLGRVVNRQHHLRGTVDMLVS